MISGAGRLAVVAPWHKQMTSLVLVLRRPGMPVNKKATHEVELEVRTEDRSRFYSQLYHVEIWPPNVGTGVFPSLL